MNETTKKREEKKCCFSSVAFNVKKRKAPTRRAAQVGSLECTGYFRDNSNNPAVEREERGGLYNCGGSNGRVSV